MKYVNCTGFACTGWAGETKDEEIPVMVIDAEPSDTVSLQREYIEMDTMDGIPVKAYRVTQIKNMPEPLPETVFIVSPSVLDYINRHTQRTDFVCMADKVYKRFDKDGNLIRDYEMSEDDEYDIIRVGYRAFSYGDINDLM
ncbi:MAG: hypothetical protein II940_03040 [Methanosarcinaceae archaeon]|nr:hypothetical protein [Methanosarcinaceae archaeon]